MSLYYTTKITREQAIERIVEKRIQLIKKEIEIFLNSLTNEELEEILYKNKVSDDEYEDFSVEDLKNIGE